VCSGTRKTTCLMPALDHGMLAAAPHPRASCFASRSRPRKKMIWQPPSGSRCDAGAFAFMLSDAQELLGSRAVATAVGRGEPLFGKAPQPSTPQRNSSAFSSGVYAGSAGPSAEEDDAELCTVIEMPTCWLDTTLVVVCLGRLALLL